MTRPGIIAVVCLAMLTPAAASAQVSIGIYETACDGGDGAACNVLGLMYETGEGAEADASRAVELFEAGCTGGFLLACTNLGRLYSSGSGVEEDVDIAVELFWTACEAGERLACGLLQAEGVELGDPLTGGLSGRITDAISGQGLSQVRVATGGGSEQAMTSGDGSFVLRGVPAGRQTVEMSRFGYESRTVELVVLPDRTVELAAELSAEPLELEAIEVSVRPVSLERVGFYERSVEGIGRQLTRMQIGNMNLARTSEVLRNIPSIYTRITANGIEAFSRRGQGISGTCRMGVYMDGMRVPNFNLDSLHPDAIEAMEVYHGVNTPIQYRNACGVLLIWTR